MRYCQTRLKETRTTISVTLRSRATHYSPTGRNFPVTPPETLEAIWQDILQGRFSEAAETCLTILRRDPKDGPVIYLYGKLALDMGRADDAIVILRKLLALKSDHKGAHEDLAYAYRQTGDQDRAKHHAHAALSLDPKSLMARIVLGSIAISEGKEDEARRHVEEARALAPGHLGVEKLYVSSLLNMGRFSEAQDLLRNLIARHPGDALLYQQLADTHRFTENDPDLEIIKSLEGPDGSLALDCATADRAYGHFALFKVESDLDHTDAAFAHLRRAKDIRKSIIPPYDAQETEDRRRQMEDVFNATFFDSEGATGCDSRSPIFIVGMPRSGTSLLERVISSHPEVAAGGEMPIAGRLLEEACVKAGQNQYDLPALKTMPREYWRDLGEAYLRLARQRVGDAAYFTDKMPDNAFRIGFIRAMLPDARIVHIARHPVATCLSIYEQDFTQMNYSNDLAWVGARYVSYRRAMEHWRGLFGDSIIEIDYESLVNDTAAAVETLGQQLGLHFDPAAIASSQQEGEIATASRWQARQPIHGESVDRWQRLAPQLQPLLEALAPVWEST